MFSHYCRGSARDNTDGRAFLRKFCRFLVEIRNTAIWALAGVAEMLDLEER